VLPPTQQAGNAHRAKGMQHMALDRLNQATLEAQNPWNLFDHSSQGVHIRSLHQGLDPFDDLPFAKGLV
jgi:hypothetical protein